MYNEFMNTDEQNPKEKWTSLGVDPETYERLKALADEDGRSIIGELRWIISRVIIMRDLEKEQS